MAKIPLNFHHGILGDYDLYIFLEEGVRTRYLFQLRCNIKCLKSEKKQFTSFSFHPEFCLDLYPVSYFFIYLNNLCPFNPFYTFVEGGSLVFLLRTEATEKV